MTVPPTPAAPVRIEVLGPVTVTRDGAPLPRLRSRAALVLLALLVTTPAGRTRDDVATLLWPAAEPAARRAELSRLLYDVRTKLGPVVEADRRWLRLADELVDSDVGDVTAALASTDPVSWAAAVDGVRGPFASDVDLALDRHVDDELLGWVEAQRVRRRGQVSDLVERLVADAASAGDDPAALTWAHRWIAADPTDQRAHRAVMTALARAGRPGAAVTHHARLVETLERESGDVVEPATRDLAQAITAGRLGTAALPAVISAPPRPPTPLLGRDALVRRTQELLARPDVRVVTLTGPGGVGKTRVAVEVATRASGTAGGTSVMWVDLTPLTRSALVLPTLAAALRTATRSDPGPENLATVVRTLAGRPVLLVLDNLEQIPGVGAVVADLLESLPALTVLGTSRGPVRLPGEHVVPVDPLPAATAEELFRARVCEIGGDLGPAGDDEAAGLVAEVCARLDGLPLALELVAAQVRLVGVRGLRQLVDEVADLPAAREVDRPERQRTLRRTVLWGADLLPAATRAVFAALGVFAGPFTLESAAALTPAGTDPEAAVTALLDAGLLAPGAATALDNGDPADARYRLLPTVASVARAELQAAGAEDAARAAHGQLFLRRAAGTSRWGTDARGRDQHRRMAELQQDVADLRAALQHAASTPGTLLADLVLACRDLWWTRRLAGEGCRWVELCLSRSQLPLPLRGELLVLLGHLQYLEGAVEDGQATWRALADIADQLSGTPEAAVLRCRVLTGRSAGAAVRGDWAVATAHAEAAHAAQAALPDEDRDDSLQLFACLTAVAPLLALGDTAGVARWLDVGWELSRRSLLLAPQFDVLRAATALMTGRPADALPDIARGLRAAQHGQVLFLMREMVLLAASAALGTGAAAESARLLGFFDHTADWSGEPEAPTTTARRAELARHLTAVLGGVDFAAAVAAGRSIAWADIDALLDRLVAAPR